MRTLMTKQGYEPKRVLLKVSAVLAMAVVGSWAAGPPVSAASEAPLRARFVVTQTLTPDVACGGLHVSATGSGMATRLGAGTDASFDECSDFVQEPGRVHVYGSLVLTSPSGDELHLWVDKVGNPPGPTGEVHVAGPYTVTGGTGRFEGATGSGTTSSDTNITSEIVVVDLIGTLSLAPAS